MVTNLVLHENTLPLICLILVSLNSQHLFLNIYISNYVIIILIGEHLTYFAT